MSRGVRWRGSAVAAVLVSVALTGCGTPAPAPTPTPTGFATEDEAFAAAEATYRAYVDALNQVDLSDPETFEEVYAWTTGTANAEERKSLSSMHAEGWSVGGDSVVELIAPAEFDIESRQGTLVACLDVSGITLVDAGGESMVSSDRPHVQTVEVLVVASSTTATGLAVAALSGYEGVSPCS